MVLSPDWIQNMLEKKAGSTTSLQLAWKPVLENFASLGADNVQPLVEHLPSPRTGRLWVKSLSRESDPARALDTLFELIDSSDYDRESWFAALDFFHHWLEENQKESRLSLMVGFTHCCCMAGATKGMGTPLVDIIREMLEDYGFEGAEDQCF